MATVDLCGFRGCRNPRRKGEARCHLHLELVEEGTGPDLASVGVDEAILRRRLGEVPAGVRLEVPTLSSHEGRTMAVSLLSDVTDIAPDLAGRVYDAVSRVAGRADLSVPEVSASRADEGFDRFVSELTSSGVAPSRVSVLRLSGFNRVVTGRGGALREQSDGEVRHEVVVLDRDTANEVVVDPFVSSFAPVRRHDLPVESELDSGSTPFGDVPFVGTVSEYVDGPFMWWDHADYASVTE